MAVFPTLKSGAIAQYPSERAGVFSTSVLEFVDAAEQRYPQYGSVLHRWLVRLELLTEEEMFQLEQFFLEQSGGAGSFSFTDPWDSAVYPDCSFESDEVGMSFVAVGMGQTSVVVKENR